VKRAMDWLDVKNENPWLFCF